MYDPIAAASDYVPYNDTFSSAMIYIAIFTSVGGLWQFYRLMRKPEEASAISSFTWLLALVANASWTAYGLMIRDEVVFYSSVVGMLGDSMVLVSVQWFDEGSLCNLLFSDDEWRVTKMVECPACGSHFREAELTRRMADRKATTLALTH
jgi:hypothetical protein